MSSGFFKSFFWDDPTYSLTDAEAIVWDNYPDEFRDFWGLDAAAPPEGMSEEDWRDYRQLSRLVERLATGAHMLVRPRKTPEDQLSFFSWVSHEAVESEKSLNATLSGMREQLGDDLWWQIYWATRPRALSDPRMKKAFMRNCMQLEAMRLFPNKYGVMADRLFQLTGYVVRRPGQRVRDYLPRVAECFVRGMDLELAVMARAVLDAALQDTYSDDVVRVEVGAGKDVGLWRRIQCAASRGPFSEAQVFHAADLLRRNGNDAAHASLDVVIDREETVTALVKCLEALDKNAGSAS